MITIHMTFETTLVKLLTTPLNFISIDNIEFIKMSTCGELALGRELTLNLSKTLLKLNWYITDRLPRP